MLGAISTLLVGAIAISAGAGLLSFWWVLIPIFFASSFSISNGPHFDRVLEANEAGRLGYFPALLAAVMLGYLFAAGLAYWVTKAIT